MGLDDSGGAGLNARMRVLVLIPHADARVDWYAAALGAGFVLARLSSSSSSMFKPSSESVTSSSDPRPPRSKALAALASTVDPSPLELDFGRWSSLPVPALQIASLAVRLGMKRSAELYAMRVLVGLERMVLSFFDLAGVLVVVVVPVPVSDHSDTPSSNRRGDCVMRAMFDFGESCVFLEIERWKRDMRLPPWIDSCAWTSGVWVLGVRGEGVNGIRPPAVRVEKTEERLLTGVNTAALAMAASSQLYVC